MKFCSNCGKQVSDEAVVCTSCGCSVASKPVVKDELDLGFLILSIIVPFAGIILWVAKKEVTPKTAPIYGISNAASIGGYILWFIICLMAGLAEWGL